MKKVVALDFGSSTFLALGVEGTDHGISRVHFDLTETVRLGEKVSETKTIQSSALARARQCLVRFKESIDQFKPDEIKAVATAAARQAQNKHELFDLAKEFGIPIDIIEGDREARISFAGAMDPAITQGRNLALVDIGGGSTEIILSNDGKVIWARSFPMGGVSMTEKYFKSDHSRSEGVILAQLEINQYLDQVPFDQILPVDTLVAVAGTPTSLAASELGGFVESKVHGYQLSGCRLEDWVQKLRGLSPEEIQKTFNMGSRSDIILAGSLILKCVQSRMNCPVTVSTKGVRYGLALEMLHAI